MVTTISFEWPHLPKSVNNLYFTQRGRRVLSTEGRKFKQAFVTQRGGLTATELMKFRPLNDHAYALELWFFIPRGSLYNASWGQSRATKSPFRDIDTSNLVKLAEDAISELLGIRDRNNFSVLAHKREATDGFSGLVARISPLDLENDPYGLH